jgi:hypothetical protein
LPNLTDSGRTSDDTPVVDAAGNIGNTASQPITTGATR